MKKHQQLQLIRDSGVIAIMRADNPDLLAQAAQALQAGGVGAIEVTMTTPGTAAAAGNCACGGCGH